jgi:hypothetical protein
MGEFSDTLTKRGPISKDEPDRSFRVMSCGGVCVSTGSFAKQLLDI